MYIVAMGGVSLEAEGGPASSLARDPPRVSGPHDPDPPAVFSFSFFFFFFFGCETCGACGQLTVIVGGCGDYCPVGWTGVGWVGLGWAGLAMDRG